MIDTLTGYVEKNWARPYRFATSLLGLLLIFGLFNKPLATASTWLTSLGAYSWSRALATANAWMIDHQTEWSSFAALVGVGVATGLAARTMSNPPTRPAETFWLLAALAMYGGSLGGLVLYVIVGLAVRVIIEVAAGMGTIQDALRTAGFCLLDIAAAAFALPGFILLWIFLPRTSPTPG